MHLFQVVAVAGLMLLSSCNALPNPLTDLDTRSPHVPGCISHQIETRQANGNYTGYLATFFYGNVLKAYMALSNGNNPLSFNVLNKNLPILTATGGQEAVRDPHIIAGGGSEVGKKWYIVTTDQDSAHQESWDQDQRTGSRAINIWESTDCVTWGNYRNIQVEDPTAGMVWAPDAIWDTTENKYFVYWSLRFFAASDTRHTGTPSLIKIRGSYTLDFKTFSAPFDYQTLPQNSMIDLNIVWAGDRTYYCFTKDETRHSVFFEYSTTGLKGPWTRPGGGDAFIQGHTEGPAAYLDNNNPQKIHVWLDNYGVDKYHPWETTQPESNTGWTRSSESGFPKNMRHGKVIQVTEAQWEAINTKWG